MGLRSTRRRGLICSLWVALLASAAAANPARHDLHERLPGGRSLHLVCEGEGSPTVLMESGFGATADAWFKVQPELAHDTRVCSYDRAGYGASDPAPPPRDGAAIARDLDQALRAARISGPFVLVGHSAGALYVQIFARLRPGDVKGMVLVDPSVAHQDRRFAEVFGSSGDIMAPLRTRALRCADYLESRLALTDAAEQARCSTSPPHGPGAVGPQVFWRTELAELDTLWSATSDEVPTGRGTLGAMPLIVLTAGGTNLAPGAAEIAAQARWRDLHQELAGRSTAGEERLVPGASHLIMIDHPEAVIAAVRKVIAAGRNSGGRGSLRAAPAPVRRNP